ncbi:MAG: 16S rRNA (cytidine(1402)-2'-O)-methyltransferase [Cytophagales bacterium]|nr:16S rRNA (cytidine(1402)-2'-O)-methyltransferase [Armatimonadota bacterium]
MADAETTPDSAPGGTLYLVATPIGNLEDITLRALRILREADLIAAEDTRVTRKLLAHFDIHTPLTSYHAHTAGGKSEALVEKLQAGQNIALVSDAGTPAISDPGAELVAEAVAGGVRVEPVPGPSALVAALVASGLPTGRFVFEGFLPRTKADRRERLLMASREARTTLFYEAPTRVRETLGDLAKVCGPERRVVAAREITKKFEEFAHGTLAEVGAHFGAHEPRGEFVLVLDGASGSELLASQPDDTPTTEALLREAMARGQSARDAARDISRQTREPRNEVYALAMRIRGEVAGS